MLDREDNTSCLSPARNFDFNFERWDTSQMSYLGLLFDLIDCFNDSLISTNENEKNEKKRGKSHEHKILLWHDTNEREMRKLGVEHKT